MCSKTNASLQPVGRAAPTSEPRLRLHTSVRRFIPYVCRLSYFLVRKPLSRVRVAGHADPVSADRSRLIRPKVERKWHPFLRQSTQSAQGSMSAALVAGAAEGAFPPVGEGSPKLERFLGPAFRSFESRVVGRAPSLARPLPTRVAPRAAASSGRPRSPCSKRATRRFRVPPGCGPVQEVTVPRARAVRRHRQARIEVVDAQRAAVRSWVSAASGQLAVAAGFSGTAKRMFRKP